MNIEAEQREMGGRAEDAVSREQMGLPKSTKLIASGGKKRDEGRDTQRESN